MKNGKKRKKIPKIAEADPCPFCGSSRITVYEDRIRKKTHIFHGSLYIFARCLCCGAQGPYSYRVEQTDREAHNYGIENWNDRSQKCLGLKEFLISRASSNVSASVSPKRRNRQNNKSSDS